MEQRRLGPSGLTASVVGLGCNNLGRPGTRTESLEGTRELVSAALDAGITFFDTADIYGPEYGLSESLPGQAAQGVRDRMVIATKFGNSAVATPHDRLGAKGSRAYLRAAVEGSLSRLGVERIDLYQQHSPDLSTPVEETLGALDELLIEGKIAAYGHSNYDGTGIREAQAAAERLGVAPFATAQNHYNLIERGAELESLPAAEAAGLGFLPFYPLANGLLTGAFRRDDIPEGTRVASRPKLVETAPWDALEAYAAFAEARGITPLQATFGWFLARPVVASVIAGATRPEQLRANAAAGEAWRPTAEDLEELDRIFPPA